MPATERLVAILKSSDILRTAECYAAAGFEVRGSQPEVKPTWCEVALELVLRDPDGYYVTFPQRSTLS